MAQQVNIPERLQKCIDAGGVVALFPLLKDWSKDELRALTKDLDAYHEEAAKAIEETWKELCFKPRNFLSKSRSEALDAAKKDAHLDLLSMTAQIYSVALHYLGDDEEAANG